MGKYRVLINGQNFLVQIDDEGTDGPRKLGFFTNVYVEAADEAAAEQKAIELLQEDDELVELVLNPDDDNPQVFVEEVEALRSFQGKTLPREAIVFYDEEDDDENEDGDEEE